MAQMTNHTAMTKCKLEVSLNGSAWTDISGFATGVAPSGGSRQTGETYTFDGDTALISQGKRQPVDLLCKTAYSEGAGDVFEIVRAAYEAGNPLYVRWSPKGGASGDFLFTSPAGTITEFGYPGGEASGGDPVPHEFTVKVAYVTKSVIA